MMAKYFMTTNEVIQIVKAEFNNIPVDEQSHICKVIAGNIRQFYSSICNTVNW